MAEITNTAVIGAFAVRPTGYGQDSDKEDLGQLETLKRYDKTLGSAGHDRMHHRPASYYQIDLYVITSASSNTKVSASFLAPWPFTIWAADVACETCAATVGTVDILNEGTTILDAPQDVKTAVGVGQRVAPEVGKDDVLYNEAITINQIADDAAMVGGQAHLYCQRL